MNSNIRNAVLFVFAVFALFYLISFFSNPLEALKETNFLFFSIGALSFIASIAVWLFAWSWLIRKHFKISYKKLFILGFSAVYGALSPVQIGSEALRVVQLKHYFKVPYSYSIAASMLVKAFKFLVLLFIALIVFVFFFSNFSLEPVLLLGFLSGIAVIVFAVLFFLLPFSKRFASIMYSVLLFFSKKIKFFSKIAEFFKNYSGYLKKITPSNIFFILAIVSISWIFEILALYFAFLSVSVSISLISLLVFFAVSALLERAPFLPRGIGLVELVGAAMLSLPGFTGFEISIPQIGAVLIVFDLFRLIIPTLLSFAVFGFFSKKLKS